MKNLSKEKGKLLFNRLNELFGDYDFDFDEIVNYNVKDYNEEIDSHRWIKKHIYRFDKLCVEIGTSYIEEVKDILDKIDTYNGTFCGISVEEDSDGEYYTLYADFSNLYDSLFNGE